MVTDRQQQIIDCYKNTGSMQETAKELGITVPRVWYILSRHESGKLRGQRDAVERTPYYYRDTGCADKSHPSCLNCPLEKCRHEIRRGL